MMRRVYISSTSADLENERGSVRDAIRRLSHLAAGMELYGASEDRPSKVCVDDVKDCQPHVINANSGRIQSCLQRADPPVTGSLRMSVDFEIAPGGRVKRAEIGTEIAAGLRKCIESALQTWRFPMAEESTLMRVPLVLVGHPVDTSKRGATAD